MAWINKRISPVFQTSFVPLQGVAAVVLTYLFLGTPPTVSDLAGGAVVVAGLGVILVGQYGDARAAAAAKVAAAKAAAEAGDDAGGGRASRVELS
jgi:drug/metabolite transporter (DMT)-like permease